MNVVADTLDLLSALEHDIVADAPVAATLRRCILLSSRIGSSRLREWATQELNGYGEDADSVPPYRQIPAQILVDVNSPREYAKGLQISPSVIPEFAREMLASGPVFYQGIGELEAKASGQGSLRLSHARAGDICAEMDRANGYGPFTQTTALYWSVPASSLVGIVERVKTQLTELVADLRDATVEGELLPPAGEARGIVEKVLADGARRSKS